MSVSPSKVAVIDSDNCIGCHVCVRECPFDAIVGTNEKLHQIIFNLCTGCELCIDPCPTNCIQMINTKDIAAKTTFLNGKENKILARIKRPKSKDRFNKGNNENNDDIMAALLEQARDKQNGKG
jgi:electron transport complex protein RnfB